MARRHKPEEVVAKLRQVEVLLGQGKSAVEAVRAIGVTEQTYYRWRSEYGGLKLDQVKRLKVLETENGRLRKAVAELTLEKLVLYQVPLIRTDEPNRVHGGGKVGHWSGGMMRLRAE